MFWEFVIVEFAIDSILEELASKLGDALEANLNLARLDLAIGTNAGELLFPAPLPREVWIGVLVGVDTKEDVLVLKDF